ncbi:hypothetical protein OUZ56_028564 [Daphnia magna]|uniref:Peptidase M12A domain-containing protein n=1 Tax=Daphnia magna TaxID=35525 RepID=A0ABR0B4U1_9CRUS|nr:hypothetical protein OUZ56_028564 [Daphnia magna]
MAQQTGDGLGNSLRISRTPARYPNQVAMWGYEKSGTATLPETYLFRETYIQAMQQSWSAALKENQCVKFSTQVNDLQLLKGKISLSKVAVNQGRGRHCLN